jgi:hypothetical protein
VKGLNSQAAETGRPTRRTAGARGRKASSNEASDSDDNAREENDWDDDVADEPFQARCAAETHKSTAERVN